MYSAGGESLKDTAERVLPISIQKFSKNEDGLDVLVAVTAIL